MPLRVLIVEDSPADAELAVQELRRDGFEPRWERVETEADYRSHLATDVDVILADHSLPHFSADRALELLNETSLGIPFIVVSGAIGEEVAVLSMQHGAADFLLKDRLARLGPAVRQAIERRRLRGEAGQADARYREIVDNAIDGIFQCTPDGATVVANPALLRMFGADSVEEFRRSTSALYDVMSESDSSALRDELASGGAVKDFEARAAVTGGASRWFSWNVRSCAGDAHSPGYHEGTVRDITARKNAEAAVVRSEARFKALFDSNLIGLFVVDLKGQIIEANARFLAMLGYIESDLPLSWLGLTASELFESERIVSSDVDARGRGKPWEKSFRHSDGHDVPCLIGAVTLPERTGLCFALDLTEIKTVQARLERAKAQLEETMADLTRTQQAVIERERLHALGQMASGIAHDFNNALSPIIAYSEMLIARPEFLANQALVLKRLTTIHRAGTDAAQVVRRLRDFYRASDDRDDWADVDIGELAQQAVDLTRPRWLDQAMAAGVQYRMETSFATVKVEGSASELRELLVNLLLNAFDAMPNGGDLKLTVTPEDAAMGWVAVAVKDSGIGMTPEVRAHCFEPFFSTKGTAGTGLGLAMCHGIVRRHRGDISVESEVGVGTTMTVLLPIATPGDGRSGPGTERAPRAAVAPVEKLRVLVVDDDEVVRATIAEYLRVDGHDVEEANAPLRALAAVRDASYDVVITDRAMPQMSGDQLAREVKRTRPTVWVVMLTGFGDLMTAVGERPDGVDVVISKPLTMQVLRSALVAARPHGDKARSPAGSSAASQ
ncbi:MAG TPA: response regulator [Candidatus Dormibacteraeota bacterium]|nr:response regulator [Candidatus Dormibacteraeota bacterium]